MIQRPMTQAATMRPDASRTSARRSWIVRGLLALITSLALLPLHSARAEIIDFDPTADEVPEILEADELAKLEALTGTGIVYFMMEPSPDGRYAFAYIDGQQGVLDTESGTLMALPDDVDGLRFEPGAANHSRLAMAWEGSEALRILSLQLHFDEEGNLTDRGHYMVRVALPSMEAESQPVDWLDDFQGEIVSISPDLATVLAMQAPGGGSILAESKTVTLGQPVYRLPDDLPEGLPGVLDPNPLGSFELQQQDVELLLLEMDGTTPRLLDADMGEDGGIAGVNWDVAGGHVVLTTRSMPGWDGDRRRDNEPPGAGLPNLGSINVREALGMVAPEDNPLVTGTSMQVFATEDGSSAARFDNTDFPQGLLAGIEFAPEGGHAILTIALRSDLEGRDNPTYAYPSGLEHHLLHDLEVDKPIAPPGADGLATGLSWLDGENLAVIVADELDNRVLRFDVESEESEAIWDRPGSFWQAFIGQTEAGESWSLVSHTTIDRPLEVYRVDGEASQPRQVTEINTGAAEASDLSYQPVSWTDASGQELHGIYIHHAEEAFPPQRPGPMVVWQQGGPGGQMVNDFGASVESPYSILPNFGIPVFVANAAGRTVKSPQFYSDMAEGTNFGQLDIEQIKLGVEQLIADGVADPARVGITGCSYGGYFTMQSTRTYPDFYAAANPQCSLTDLLEEFNFGYTPFISYLMGRVPMAEAAEYLRDSPMYGAKDVTTPNLIFHGTEDFLPLPLINNIHDQLEENGTPVTFLRVEGEGHGFGNPASQAYAAQLQLEFFRELLVDPPYEPQPPQGIYLPILGMRWDPGIGQ